MKFYLIFMIIFSTVLYALENSNNKNERKSRINKEIDKQMKKEKKYSKEQIFYQKNNYDFKSAEVNKDSLESIPDIEVDDFDMDSVYD